MKGEHCGSFSLWKTSAERALTAQWRGKWRPASRLWWNGKCCHIPYRVNMCRHDEALVNWHAVMFPEPVYDTTARSVSLKEKVCLRDQTWWRRWMRFWTKASLFGDLVVVLAWPSPACRHDLTDLCQQKGEKSLCGLKLSAELESDKQISRLGVKYKHKWGNKVLLRRSDKVSVWDCHNVYTITEPRGILSGAEHILLF